MPEMPEMPGMPVRIVQISDIHLFSKPGQTLLGVNTHESYDAAINLLKKDQKPDLIILSGDLSQDGSKESYIQVADKLKEFAVPTYCIPGNHDDDKRISEIYPLGHIILDKQIVFNDWQIILLDSHKDGAVEGFLKQTELEFMQQCLRMYPTHRAIVIFHHHPIFVGSAWLDRLGLTNADELWEILRAFPQMHTILFGHVHQVNEGIRHGIQYFSAPSTCIQFKRNSDEFALEKLAPGYRWIELHSDGNLKTEVRRAPAYIGYFDATAKGY